MKEAEEVTNGCMLSQAVVSVLSDSVGVRCSSNLIDPAKLLQTLRLSLKLESGVLTSHKEAAEYDSTSSSLLEL